MAADPGLTILILKFIGVFDTNYPNILLNRLESIGISHTGLPHIFWTAPSLNPSTLFHVSPSAFQGSEVGPLIVIIYTVALGQIV